MGPNFSVTPPPSSDVIVAVNGDEIDDSRDLARKIAELHPNTDVKI
jgi:serine protease Do